MPDVKGYNLPNHSETYMYADAKVRNAGYGDAPKIILDTASDNDGSLLNTALDNVLATMTQDETKQVLFYSYPNITNAYCLGTLYKHNDNEAVVNGSHYRDNSGSFLKKKANGTWLPHEWTNPPMALGVEYRTTERWNCKVVYTKLVDCGAFPSMSVKIVPHGASGVNIIRFAGSSSYFGIALPYYDPDNCTSGVVSQPIAEVWAHKNSIYIACRISTWTNSTCYVQIWYTKE